MSFQSLCPYGLKNMMECITKATLLSQPTDIPEFLIQYLSELVSFRRSLTEADIKVVALQHQELWENKFLSDMREMTPNITAETSPPVPSQVEVQGALKALYTDLASSVEENVVTPAHSQRERLQLNKPTVKGDMLAATPMYPTPPPRVGRQLKRNMPPPFLEVKGEKTPAHPGDVRMRTRRVSSVRCPSRPPKTTERTPTTTGQTSSTPTDVPVPKISVANKPGKLPSVLVPVVTHQFVVPPIQKKEKRGGQLSVVQGKDVSSKLGKLSPVRREVMTEKSRSRSPAGRRWGPEKANTKSEMPSFPRLESSKQLETTSTKIRPTLPKVQKSRKARGKPGMERSAGGTVCSGTDSEAMGTDNVNRADVSRSPQTCPDFANAIHITRYRRMQKTSST